MTRVFFDADKMIAEMETRRPGLLAERLAMAKTERDRASALAQDALFPALMAANRVVIELRNAGRDDSFVGSVFGAHVGNVVLNVMLNAASPAVAMVAFSEAMGCVLKSHFEGGGAVASQQGVPGGSA